MIDHLAINTSPSQHTATVQFYEACLRPLGYTRVITMLDGQVVGLGVEGAAPDFWIGVHSLGSVEKRVTCAHFAFRAMDRATVDKCYTLGMEAGGKDNGKPGLRPQYRAGYYGGFMIDPIGNNMEIVCHGEEGS